jgi:hypothetical protein
VIHSSIKDIWMRVEIMHSVAQTYYLATHDSEFRGRMITGGAPFPFDATKYDTMEKESPASCINYLSWSVFAL